MLPEGFKSTSSTEATYEKSVVYGSVEGRGGPPTQNAEGYKQITVGIYTDSPNSDPREAFEPKGEENIEVDENEPAAYSRDWS
jgi:hypothetical protein